MDCNRAQQSSNEIESAFSEFLPVLYQLLKNYEVSCILEIRLFNLDDVSISSAGSCFCNGVTQRPCKCPGLPTSESSALGLDSEKGRQFLEELDSKLPTILHRLRQSAKQIDGSFEAHFLIHPATVNPEQPVACHWISDKIIKCFDL
jgi:hypothetical protein